MSFALSSFVASLNLSVFNLTGSKFGFSLRVSVLPIRPDTRLAIGREHVSPGYSIPTRFIAFGISMSSSIRKSRFSFVIGFTLLTLIPAKLLIYDCLSM